MKNESLFFLAVNFLHFYFLLIYTSQIILKQLFIPFNLFYKIFNNMKFKSCLTYS